MPIAVADRPLFTTIQSAIRTMLRRPASRFSSREMRRDQEAGESAVIYRQLTSIGDQLQEAMAAETELAKLDLANARSEQVEQWNQCRRRVEQLTADYLSVIEEWRAEIAA
jgi:hypothetical protein